MDIGGVEHQGGLAQQKTSRTENNHRLPLLPSKKNNDISATRKPKNVASRYKSGISSTPVLTPSSPRRHPSPNASHTSPAPAVSLPKRPQSAERIRPTTPSSRFSAPSSPSRPSTPSSPSSRSTTPAHDMVVEIHSTTQRLLSNRTPDGLWPSMRSLSSSFQSESPVISVSKKEKVVVNSSEKTIKSPANIVIERKMTPRRGRNSSDQSENSKPLDNSNARIIDQCRWPGMLGGRSSANGLSRSVDLSDKSSRSASLTVALRGVSPKRTNPSSDSATRVPQPSLSEVTERVFNDGGGRAEQCVKSVVNSSSQISVRYSSVTRSNKTQSSPVPGLRCLSSPNKVLSTSTSSYTARGMSSPSRTRPSTPVSSSSNVTSRMVGTSSVLNYSVGVQKGKKNRNHIEDAHQLKLLYNANLQWRFVNARADKTLLVQKMKTEMAYLERWVALEREHCSSLSGAVEALNASTLRLPITGGAKAAVVDVKNAVSSAVDVMQAMGSSICHLPSKVEGTKSLVFELSTIVAREKSMLDECRDLLASTAAMQCSYKGKERKYTTQEKPKVEIIKLSSPYVAKSYSALVNGIKIG
ncbi:hypothetical protein MUK42_37203 [Musa troglodytarum]|uniref:Uncharacterized protein n=1 Tax=Musa troglodytarum TaxID=320322 RepID=A0A9E7KH79_9LILI|nr:hypothetical protein MUK42_37203 [Musa troglodytarum]URE18266.1 hypothetical protein MUK42_37203 [Musa troglodytarum]